LGNNIHEAAWLLHTTEECPTRSYDDFHVKVFPASQSQCEMKSMPQLERVYHIYTTFLTIGEEVRKVIEQGKGQKAIDSILQNNSLQSIPAQEDLQAVIGVEVQTLKEYLEFVKAPDIVLEDELVWPVKPDFDY